MKSPSIGRKPSERHFLWESGGQGDIKRFDEDYFRRWCRHFGFEFDTYTRVDHDRGDEPRKQYQCVFSHQQGAGDSFEIGDREWTIRTDEIPRTFVEIDDEGLMRVRGWSIKRILDVVELLHAGPKLLVRARNEDKRLKLDTRKLTR